MSNHSKKDYDVTFHLLFLVAFLINQIDLLIQYTYNTYNIHYRFFVKVLSILYNNAQYHNIKLLHSDTMLFKILLYNRLCPLFICYNLLQYNIYSILYIVYYS